MISCTLEQDAAIRMVLSEDRKITHIIPTWQDATFREILLEEKEDESELTKNIKQNTCMDSNYIAIPP